MLDFFSEITNLILNESDGGAVLIGTSIIDDHLKKMIANRLPSDMQSKKKQESLFEYPGLLSGFAAKNDVARAAMWISESVYKSINILRHLRNDIAHKPVSFRLSNHKAKIDQAYDLGKGMAEYINIGAVKLVMEQFITSLQEEVIESPIEGEPRKPMFADWNDILDRVARVPEAMASLETK